MTPPSQALPAFLAEPSLIGDEISVTGKWIPTKKGGLFRRSQESREMVKEWADIHSDARADEGVLSTEINHGVGEESVLVHHVFRDADALEHYFSTTATQHMSALTKVAKPGIHLIRGARIPMKARTAVQDKRVPASFGEYIYGYVKDDYRRPDLTNAIMVTAKWACKPGGEGTLEELKYWWQRVGIDAHSLEKGLVRFEAYQVEGEDALIIHETFENTDELKFHLSKGTAAKYKKDIDQIATPDCYFFRGPVSWTIRTYSKFLHLPATYSSQGALFAQPGGTMSEGRTS
jgi:quinol monooxygenase YgiN